MKFLLQTDTQPIENLIVPDSVQKAQLAEVINKLTTLDYGELMIDLAKQGCWIVLKIILALIIYMVGRWITKWIIRIMNRAFERRQIDSSLRTFLRSAVSVIMTILIVLVAIQTLGINTTSFVAIFASAGLAIGMALSGTLQNFAGGVILLVLRPYRVGDYITAQGQSGTVKTIGLFSTQLATSDNRIIYVPNNAISSSIIDNYSQPATRRVEWKISISYGDDVDKTRDAILGFLNADSRVLSDPKPMVVLSELGADSIIITIRAWVENANYWDLFFHMNELFYKELPKHGVNFPFPTVNVNVSQNTK